MKTKIEWDGKTIQVSSRYIGYDNPVWGGGYQKQHFKITVECEGRKFTEDYWQPNRRMTESDLVQVLEMLCSDAFYGDMTIDEFQQELCYGKVSECIQSYNGCVKTLANFKSMYVNPFKLGDYLRETYNL